MKGITKASTELFAENSVFQKLTDDDLRKINGGGIPSDAQVSALMSGLFASIFTEDSTLQANAALLAEFKTEVTNLASTSVGFDMLAQLLTAGVKFQISGSSAPRGTGEQGTAQYTASLVRPVLYIGDLYNAPSSSTPTQSIANFEAISHELYHAYQQMVQKQTITYSNSIESELDAGIFQFMANEEMDLKNNITTTGNSYVWNEANFEAAPGTDTGATLRFRTAWADMFLNHNFTANNYNILVQNFKTGSYSGEDPNYVNRTTPAVTTLDGLNIMGFYNNDFETTKAPLLQSHLAKVLPASKIISTGSAGAGSGYANNPNYVYVNYNDDGSVGGGWVLLVSTDGDSSSSSSQSSSTGGGSTATGTRTWHYAGALGPVWDDNGEQLTPEEMSSLDIE